MDEQVSLAMPSLAGFELFDALDKAEELGFAAVMSLPGGPRTRHSQGEFPHLGYYDGDEAYREEVRDRLNPFTRLSIHQAWDDEWRAWIDCADYFRAEILTVHAHSRPDDIDLVEYVQGEGQRLRAIGDYAADKGIRIGVENVGGKRSDYQSLLAAVDHPVVGATIDVGHCAHFAEVKGIEDTGERVVALNNTILELARALDENLFHFHVHNVRRSDWLDHRSLDQGVIDFPPLLEELAEGGYTGLFDMELEEPDKEGAARVSGEYLTKLLKASEGKAEGLEAMDEEAW